MCGEHFDIGGITEKRQNPYLLKVNVEVVEKDNETFLLNTAT